MGVVPLRSRRLRVRADHHHLGAAGRRERSRQLLDQELTATAFRAHAYRHPTIGWLSDLQTMTRDDLYGHYRRFYVPNNATLVIVGDVDADEAMRDVVKAASGTLRPATCGRRVEPTEPEQLGERRVTVSKAGHDGVSEDRAPRAGGGRCRVLSAARARRGADRRQGRELWAELPDAAAAAQRPAVSGARQHRASPPRSAAASCRRSSRSSTPSRPRPPRARRSTPLEEAAIAAIDRVRRDGITPQELESAKTQLRARLVFENDSITNIAHQLGFFETIGRGGRSTRCPDGSKR